LFVVFAGKKQPKQFEKFQKLEKIQLRSDDGIFFKISVKCTNFEVSSLGLEVQVSVSGFLMKSRSRSFNQASVSKVTVSTASLREMKYTSQHCCDKTLDGKMALNANAVLRIVQNHDEYIYFRRF